MFSRLMLRPFRRFLLVALTLTPAMLAIAAAARPAPFSLQPARTLSADGTWDTFAPYARAGGFSQATVYDPPSDRLVTLDGGNFNVLTERLDQLTLAGVPAWTPLLARGPRPPVRDESVAVYDATRRQMVVVLSSSNDFDSHLDVWTLDTADPPSWQHLPSAAGAPPGRAGFIAVFDAPHDRVVVFGGLRTSTSSDYLNDVWAYDLSTRQWSEIDAAGALPYPRGSHAGVFDAVNDRLVVFGGLTDQTPSRLLNDVWALSLAGIPTWHLLSPSGTPPKPRTRAAAIYDAANPRMIVHGGYASAGGDQNTTWSLTLGASPAWSQLVTDGDIPPAYGAMAAVLDPVRQRMIVSSAYQEFGNVCFTLTLSGGAHWSKLYARGEAAYPYSQSYVANTGYDALHRRYAMLRMPNASGPQDPSGWVLPIDAPGAWQRVPAIGTPVSWDVAAAVLDPVRKRGILFGSAGDAMVVSLGDTFTWSPLPGVTPGPIADRYNAGLVYDPRRERWLLFGGRGTASDAALNELWEFSLATLAWNPIPFAGGPTGRGVPSLAYDSARDQLVVFGGENGNVAAPTMLRDTWVLPLTGTPTWTQIGQSGVFPLLARYGAALVYDSRRDRLVMTGGSRLYTNLDDTWMLELEPPGQWQQLAPAGDPPGVLLADYDSLGDRMLFLPAHPAPLQVHVLQFGSPATPSIGCPADLLAAHFGVNHLDYSLTNHDPLEATFDFRLTSLRGWPDFPLTGQIVVPGFGTVSIPVGIPIPDTASAQGIVTIRVWPHLEPAVADSCAHVLGDVTSSALADFISATVEGGVVHLAWHADDPSARSGLVHRRDEADPWLPIGTPTDAGAGRLQYTDASVQAGRRYAYRLAIGAAGAEEFTTTVWVEVPGTALALAGASPNPASARLRVAFTLPGSDPATLELFDLAGRRIDGREVGSLGPGPHVLELGARDHLAAGIYLARLTQSGRSLTAKVCLLHH